MNLKVKYHADIQKLESNTADKNWIDLRSAVSITMKKEECKLISLGISIELPEGYEANIVPRSSTFKNFGILQTNSFGVVDSSYKGDNDIWMFSAYAARDTAINKGDRICQFRINKIQPPIVFEEVETLGNSDRNGFGSTGIN